MTELFADDRLQFFLRNREDIKTWAAVERDVEAATREFLARAQPLIEDRVRAGDSSAAVGRRDSGPWERLLVRHQDWPPSVGLALEWHRSVDPAGAERPKVGVFWWADPETLIEPRTRLVETVPRPSLLALGFKVPMAGVWPVGMYVPPDPDWWRDPDTWLSGILDKLGEAWPIVAPRIDDVLVGVSWK